jgi:hypothetical protein
MATTSTTEVKEERKAPQGVIIPPPEIRGTALPLSLLFTEHYVRNHREDSNLRLSKQ